MGGHYAQGGGGQQLCGLFDVKPARVGLNDPVVSLASKLVKFALQVDF